MSQPSRLRRPWVSGAGLALLASTLPVGSAAAQAAIFDVGATVRMRAETYDERPFGPGGPGQDDYVLWRGLIDAGVRARTDDWAVRLQLGVFEQDGRDRGPAPTDEDHLDVRQAFVEARLWDRGRLRLGRQELAFGSSRLVSLRDGPNIRRAFDGVLVVDQRGAWRTQVFVAQPVEDRRGVFDDGTDRAQVFGGVYVTRLAKGKGYDFYWFGLQRDAARFGAITAREQRQTVGVRAFGVASAFDYNVEAIGQWGRFSNNRIRAWTLAADSGVTLANRRFRPRLGLKANVTSGDRHPFDRSLETFNPLYPNLSYFNEASLLAPQNHMDLHPSLTFDPTATLQLNGGVDWFWKATRADDVYRGPGLPIGAAGGPRRVGRQIDLNLRWRPTERVEVKASYVRFDTGPALQAGQGSDTNYGMISVQRRF